ncbi:hypothetical protein NG895_17085 [Aeoliella sp. ICT_H6.2]|uniref:Dockerin domain-containing protein n=1 Tax=Aeoliella straminimaris TaxID=2954799 RepID=A0A9X2JK01_9BACT|nr:hypothetical protein [Aeoliella straminimaris]MCO6045614.1 hypothetical protein [Aeoliella straminimaris]
MYLLSSLRPLSFVLILVVGPSLTARGQFNTVINLPPDLAPTSIDSDTQLNVLDGGVLPSSSSSGFQAGRSDGTSTNVEVNVLGGTVGDQFTANSGSEVNIVGGIVGRGFGARSGSTVNIDGGTVGSGAYIAGGSSLNLSGGTLGDLLYAEGSLNIFGNNFRLWGTPIDGLESVGDSVTLDFPYGVLDGELADGTPFALALFDHHTPYPDMVYGEIKLTVAPTSPIGPALIAASQDPVPLGIRGGQTLVVDDGGHVGDSFNAGRGSVVSIEGGIVGYGFESIGATVNVTNGSIGSGMKVFEGSQVNISGGSIDGALIIYDGTVNITGGTIKSLDNEGGTLSLSGGVQGDGLGSHRPIDVYGGECFLDGVQFSVFPGSTATILQSEGYSTLTGVYADGTPFAFSLADYDFTAISDFFPPPLTPGVTLHGAAVPPPTGPETITASTDPVPAHIREGQTLIVDSGGVVGDDFMAGGGSTITVEAGGVVGRNLETIGADVEVSGGVIETGFDAFQATTVLVTGGSIASMQAFDGSTVSVAGGAIGNLYAQRSSAVGVASGAIKSLVLEGSSAKVLGGWVGAITAQGDSSVRIAGGEFRLDGQPVPGLGTVGDLVAIDIPSGSILSGTLTDGTPFHSSDYSIDAGVLTLEMAQLPPALPAAINLPGDHVPFGIREGQTLSVVSGGTVGDGFIAGWGSTLQVDGGSVGEDAVAIGAEVGVAAGSIGDSFRAFSGSHVHVTGGLLEGRVDALEGSIFDISDGSVAGPLLARDGGEVNVSGGSLFRLVAFEGSEVNLSGGSLSESFIAGAGSTVNIYGTSFRGVRGDFTPFLMPGVPYEITGRDFTLHGVLADGTPFSFDLNTSFMQFADRFETGAFISVILVPSVLAGDYNDDGVINAADYTVWRNNLGAPDGTLPNDINGGIIGVAQYNTWRANFGKTASTASAAAGDAAVPEPTGLLHWVILVAVALTFRRHA